MTLKHAALWLCSRRIAPALLLCCLALQLLSVTTVVAQDAAVSTSPPASSADPVSSSDDSSSSAATNPFAFALDFYGGNGLEYTLSVVLIIWGCLLLVLGVRLFKLSIFVLTWIVVGGLTYYLAMLASSGDAHKSFIAAMLTGLFFGLVAVKLAVLGLVLAGAFVAFLVWEVFASMFPGAVANAGSYSVLAIVVTVGAVLAWWFQKWVLLVTTPVIGTFFLSQGLSKYLHDARYGLNVFEILHGDAACTDGECRGLVAAFAAVAATGFAIQWYWTSGLRGESTDKTLLPAGSPKSHYGHNRV